MTKSLSERIKSSRLESGLTQSELGSQCGVSRAAVALWENGDTKSLKVDSLIKASKALKKSFIWLAQGKGPEQGDPTDLFDEISPLIANSEEQPSFLKSLTFRSDWLERMGLEAEYLRTLEMNSAAMEGDIRPDDIMFVDIRSSSMESVENGAIYVIQVSESVLVKKAFAQELGGLVLQSTKEGFEPIKLSADELENVSILGRVVWAGGKVS